MYARIISHRFFYFMKWVIFSVFSVIEHLYLKAEFPNRATPFSTSIGEGIILSATDGAPLTAGINLVFTPNSQIIARSVHNPIEHNFHLKTHGFDSIEKDRPPLSDTFAAELQKHFFNKIEQLEALTQKGLSMWKTLSAPSLNRTAHSRGID